MHPSKYIIAPLLLLCMIAACKKESFSDIAFAKTATAPAKLSAMFDITQDNTGLVTITPNGEGTVSYDVYYGDNSTTPATVVAGKSIKHVYAEGTYTVKITGKNINGETVQVTQPLTVSFKAPENLTVAVATSSLSVSISAAAKYETMFRVYYGDSNNVTPVPFTSFLEGQTVTHSYANAGTYIVKVVALSGGAATTQYLDTIKVARQIDLPVTFEDSKTDYTLSDFGGNQSTVAADPANAGNKVMKSVKTAGAEVWAGTTLGTAAGFAALIPVTNNASKMSARIYSPVAGAVIKLKIEDHKDPTHSVETNTKTTVANQWETLVFDFSVPAAGTSPLNASYAYDKASVFFNFGNSGDGKTYYFDDLVMLSPALAQINWPVTFENPGTDFTVTDFRGTSTADALDPANASNHVKKTIKNNGAEVWAGVTAGTASGFATVVPLTAVSSKMSVRVYAPAAGITVKLKIEDHTAGANSAETDVQTTVANQWETLIFDLSNPASGTPAFNPAYKYDKASLFFDFGNNGDGKAYYWDDIRFLRQADLPVTFENPDTDYTVTDFGSNQTVTAPDPIAAGNTVKKTTKPNGAEVWAGTTVGTPAGFATVIPVTATRTKMTVRVYSPAAGLTIKLKIEEHANGANAVETDIKTSVANQWETLTFDFTVNSAGTPALNPAFHYDKASIFFDFGTAGNGKVFYWDDVKIL